MVIAPVVEIVPTGAPVDFEGVAAVIFTSPSAVLSGLAPGRPLRAWCVGDRTAAVARAAGFEAVSVGGAADDLVSALLAAGERGPCLHLRGAESRGEVAGRLALAGVPCRELVVYTQQDVPLTSAADAVLRGAQPVLLALFSPNSAARLSAELAGREVRAPLLLAAMSPAVAAAWRGPPPLRTVVAERPDSRAMVAALEQLATPADSP